MSQSDIDTLRDSILDCAHPQGLAFEEVPSTPDVVELVGTLVLYDIEHRGVFLWFVPLESYDIYRMRLHLEPSSRIVRLQDERETYSKSWTKLRKTTDRGVYKFLKETDSLWGRRKDGSLGKLYAYRFDIEETKAPIRALIAQAGWELREETF